MKTAGKASSKRLPETFDELNRWHPLRPVNDDIDLTSASELAGRLAVLDKRNKDQEDYLEVLSTLIEKYESDHFAIDTRELGAVELLKYLMESNDMNASDLGRLLGERSLGAAIIRGDRKLSKANIKVLCDRFRVQADVFLRD